MTNIENSKLTFHGLTMRDGIMITVFVLGFTAAFIANRTHVKDELGYATRRIEVAEKHIYTMEVRVREIEIYKAGSQQQIHHLSEQIALANQKLDRVLEKLRR